ncbi:MAG: fibronectin type III domain-containing protein, partial [Candidatus Aminicenantales bacterium]
LGGGISVGIWVLEQPKSPAAVTASGKIPGNAPASGSAENGLKDFENRATLAASIENDRLADYATAPGAARFSFPYKLEERMFGAVLLTFSVRVSDARSRDSEFATAVSFEPRAVPLPPGDFEIRPFEGAIELRWRAPEANIDGTSPPAVAGFNVYRETPDGRAALLNPNPVPDLEFKDRDFTLGAPVRYFVRASAVKKAPYAESADSEIREITPRDEFAPVPPAAVVPVSGRGFISLSWNANREKDFAGYRVRRRTEGEGEASLLTPQPIADNAFTDATVERGRVYHYSISSVDRSGNESPGTEVSAQSWKDVPQ